MYTIEDFLKDIEEEKKLFPMQTRKTLSKRWGVSRQVVSNWSERDKDFPSPVEGLIQREPRTELFYPLYAIERYEKTKNIPKLEEK